MRYSKENNIKVMVFSFWIMQSSSQSKESTTDHGGGDGKTEKEADADFENNAEFLRLLMRLDEQTRKRIGHK